MLTVLVTNLKGGCGKTTIATNLAGAFAGNGYATALADCDRQRSALAWAERRPAELAPVAAVNWVKEIGSPPKGVERLVIDAPAALDRAEAEVLVRLSDIVLLPVLPSMFDETATERFLRLLDKIKPIRKNKRAVGLVGNRVRPRTRAAEEMRRFLAGLGFQTVTCLRDSQLYATAAAQGRSLFDIDTRQADNFAADWQPLLRFIDGESLVRTA